DCSSGVCSSDLVAQACNHTADKHGRSSSYNHPLAHPHRAHTGTLHFRLSIIEKREKSLPAIQYFSIHRLRMCAIIFIFLLVQVWLLLPFVAPVFLHASFSLHPSSAGDGPCNQQQCLSIF